MAYFESHHGLSFVIICMLGSIQSLLACYSDVCPLPKRMLEWGLVRATPSILMHFHDCALAVRGRFWNEACSLFPRRAFWLKSARRNSLDFTSEKTSKKRTDLSFEPIDTGKGPTHEAIRGLEGRQARQENHSPLIQTENSLGVIGAIQPNYRGIHDSDRDDPARSLLNGKPWIWARHPLTFRGL